MGSSHAALSNPDESDEDDLSETDNWFSDAEEYPRTNGLPKVN